MSCFRPDRMDLYLDGELVEAERREFEEHLALCPACRRALEDRRTLDQAFSSLPPIEVPPDFAAAILARLPEDRRAFGWFASIVTGTALLFAGLLGYHILTGESLLGILMSVGRSVIGFIGLAVPLIAKVLELVRVFLKLTGDLGAALIKGLGILSSLLRPEIIGFTLLLGLALSLLLVLGVKKIVSLGEKS